MSFTKFGDAQPIRIVEIPDETAEHMIQKANDTKKSLDNQKINDQENKDLDVS